MKSEKPRLFKGICRIRSVSTSEKKRLLRSSSSHLPVIGHMSSETFVKTALPLGEIILLVGLEGIHGSDQISMDSPSPTLHT
jgi:hypothetical protein